MALGLLISEEKCSWGARTQLEWTGFNWDTMQFQLSVTDRKIEKASALISELSCSTGPVGIRQVASLVGLLGSFYLAMGPRSRFHSRGLMTFVASQVQKLGWNGCAELDSQCQAELSFWNDNLRSLNGARIRTEGTVRDLNVRDLVSDARGESLFGQAVCWVTDSQSAVTILTVGSMKPRCHAVAVHVWDLAHAHNIRLSCVWMPRTSAEIMVADDLSKNFDTSEYKLSRNDFGMFSQRFGPFCLDLFASPFFLSVQTVLFKVLVQGSCGCGHFHD